MIVSEISRQAAIFRDEIMRLKLTLNNSDFWYRYSTLSNFEHLENLFGGGSDLLSKITADGPILDIGGADGDLAFFLSTLGVSVSALEHAPTNHNGLEGMKLLNNHFGSPLDIKEADLDAGGTIEGKYSLVYFLGVLYHLKNPYLRAQLYWYPDLDSS